MAASTRIGVESVCIRNLTALLNTTPISLTLCNDYHRLPLIVDIIEFDLNSF